MKKIFYGFLTLTFIIVSSIGHAGVVKNILIDAEDAIYSEFFENGLRVERIYNLAFLTLKSGIGIKAEVETSNPVSKMGQSWTCIVRFEEINRIYVAQDVDCN